MVLRAESLSAECSSNSPERQKICLRIIRLASIIISMVSQSDSHEVCRFKFSGRALISERPVAFVRNQHRRTVGRAVTDDDVDFSRGGRYTFGGCESRVVPALHGQAFPPISMGDRGRLARMV